jgi:hypothetical protein
MGDLFAIADEAAAFVLDLRSDPKQPSEGIPWHVPITFRPSENWHTSVNEKLAGMCLGYSALQTAYSRDVMAPRMFLETIEVNATTRADANIAAAAVVLEAVDRGLVPNWQVRIGEAIPRASEITPGKPR